MGRLREVLGEGALAPRLERDRLAVLLPRGGGEPAEAVESLLEHCFRLGYDLEGGHLHVVARAGASLATGAGDDAAMLVRDAETAMARGKATHARVVLYRPEMLAEVTGLMAVESRLRGALERGEFVLHYQPRFDARDGALVGAEGLLRWYDGERGVIPPAHVIPVLEDTGLILEVGRWVMR